MQSTPPKRYQQLQPEDRVTLTRLAQQQYSVRAMAQTLGRSPSTISRATPSPQAAPAPRRVPVPCSVVDKAVRSIKMTFCSD